MRWERGRGTGMRAMREHIEGLVRSAAMFTMGVSICTARVLLSITLNSITFGARRHKSRKTGT